MRASASRFCNDHPDNEVNLRCFKDTWYVLHGPVLLHTSGELICPIRLRGMPHQTTWSSWVLVLLPKCVPPNTPPPFCSLFSLSTQSQLCALKSEKLSPIAVEPTTTPVAGEKHCAVVPPSCAVSILRAVSVLRAVSEKMTRARCLDFSSFCSLSPFSSCTTTARCGTTIRSQTSPEYPKSRSCARCFLPSRLTPFAQRARSENGGWFHSERRNGTLGIQATSASGGWFHNERWSRKRRTETERRKRRNPDSELRLFFRRQRVERRPRRRVVPQRPFIHRRQEWSLVPRRPGTTSRILGHTIGDCVEREKRE
ncbi:hypothetical protein Fot_16097 [Forsythia ovata]|uniref:Uncharacterized protein n=1 Tax=Forsythia ovata TaxID=205694 RepID=A0ABD1WB20_9LAMI